MSRITQRNKRKNKKRRKSNNSGASVKKRPKTSSRTVTDDDSEIIESEESEALPENYAGETKESDGDRRGREKKERERKKIEDKAERKRQAYAKSAANKTKLCIANIGGKRVKKNGIMTFEGGTDFGPFSSRPIAEEATGISLNAIKNNIFRGSQSNGKKGIFKGQKVMFINAPVDTSDKVPCDHCNKHFSIKSVMIRHVREKHPEVLSPAREYNRMPEEYKTFSPQITPKQYSYLVRKVASNIKNDIAASNVSEEDKIKLTEMNNNKTRHMIARQYCEHMNEEGMFAKKNVTDDNGGLLKNGFEFESHGGLFAISFDRIEDNYTVNGQTFRKLHYPDPKKALENINVVALMANVRYKASTDKIQERYDIYKNKSVKQHQEEFKKVLDISNKKTLNCKPTPLNAHAHHLWRDDKQCHGAFATYQDYWKHMLVLLEKQKGLCAVAKIPMSLESGPWLMSCDAIDPLLGHVPDNLRLVCLYNNVTDTSKLNKDLADTTPTSPNTEIHDEYWRIVRDKE
jgi:hypothetical protein